MVTVAEVTAAVSAVCDPEIPVCSIADLGMVNAVEVSGDAIRIELLPTFVGCPARYAIAEDVRIAVRLISPDSTVDVQFVYDPPWTTSRVNEKAREGLRSFGISPDQLPDGGLACPYCGSADTVVDSPFGPTPCRSTHSCKSCRNVFEGFKDKGAGRHRLSVTEVSR